MSMHLESPRLTTIGKKKGKRKFRSAKQAQEYRKNIEETEKLRKKWGIDTQAKKTRNKTTLVYHLSPPAGRNTTENIKSLDTRVGVAAGPESKVYTGTLIKGICQTHKSNAVPVINQEEIVNIRHMRR